MFRFELEQQGNLWYYKIYKNGKIFLTGHDHGAGKETARRVVLSYIEKYSKEGV